MWNDTCVANMKIGPYYLHQGVTANSSTKAFVMNPVGTLLKDVPVGYQVASRSKANEIVRFMYKSGEVFATDRYKWSSVPTFFSYKQFILFNDNDNQYGIFQLKPEKDYMTPLEKETIGQALLLRTSDFKHM